MPFFWLPSAFPNKKLLLWTEVKPLIQFNYNKIVNSSMMVAKITLHFYDD